MTFNGSQRLHRKAFVDRNLRWLYGRLEASGCVDCGAKELLILDFDHIGAKRGNVTALARDGYSRAVLEAELAQCEVRCANCHRIRTVETRRQFRALALTSRAPL